MAPLPSLIFLFFFVQLIHAQVSIPAKFDGFLYQNHHPTVDSIMIEAFFDPVCPDSRDSWPPLKQALHHYGSRISLLVHPFALPYHDNAFITSRALHIVNNLNTSATYDLLELFFKHQEEFYNKQTFNMSRAYIVNQVMKYTSKAVGNSYYSAIESSFFDRKTDLATRISFKWVVPLDTMMKYHGGIKVSFPKMAETKSFWLYSDYIPSYAPDDYGCSRGVYGTPFFFVNGFSLPTAGSPLNYKGWKSVIDPLVGQQRMKRVEPLHFF